MTIEWTENQGAFGFGPDDYDFYRAKGYSDSDIRSFITSNSQFFGEGRANVGAPVRQRLGLGNEFANELNNRSQDERSRLAEVAYKSYLSNLDQQKSKAADEARRAQESASYQSQISQYQSQLSGYQKQLEESKSGYEKQLEESRGGYEKQLGDLRSSLDQYRTQFDAARTSYESTLKQRDDALKQRETDLLKAQADAQSYQADAERYRDLSINSQLQDLRAGAQSSNGPQSGEAPSLSSGIRRPSRGIDRTLVDVRSRMDATDSVLNRRRPVVELINRGDAPTRSAPAGGVEPAGSSSGAAGYYARRFG